MYFKGPIWSTKVHKVLQSERKKACVLQWINFCPLGQKFPFFESTKTHQVFQSERKKTNVLQWIHKLKTSCPKGHQRSTKVHQPDPLKYTSVAGSTKVHQEASVLQWIRLVYFSGPLMTFRARFSPIVGPLKYTRFCKVRKKSLCTLVDH